MSLFGESRRAYNGTTFVCNIAVCILAVAKTCSSSIRRDRDSSVKLLTNDKGMTVCQQIFRAMSCKHLHTKGRLDLLKCLTM
jgi:hypothetical protein